MNFHTRKWIKPEDLNPNGTLFGGSLLRCVVRNKITQKNILTIERIVFANMGANGKPAAHGKTEITYSRERLEQELEG